MRKSLIPVGCLAWFGMSLCLLSAGAHAEYRTNHDTGGRIADYVQKYDAVRDSGQRVVVDGMCLSACTLVLGIVPRERMCATPKAQLGFHKAWMPGYDGRPVPSTVGTRLLMEIYPPKVRKWLKARGGLKEKMLFAQATNFLPPCPSRYADAPTSTLPTITVTPESTHAAR